MSHCAPSGDRVEGPESEIAGDGLHGGVVRDDQRVRPMARALARWIASSVLA